LAAIPHRPPCFRHIERVPLLDPKRSLSIPSSREDERLVVDVVITCQRQDRPRRTRLVRAGSQRINCGRCGAVCSDVVAGPVCLAPGHWHEKSRAVSETAIGVPPMLPNTAGIEPAPCGWCGGAARTSGDEIDRTNAGRFHPATQGASNASSVSEESRHCALRTFPADGRSRLLAGSASA
jgi:hypothetical protein